MKRDPIDAFTAIPAVRYASSAGCAPLLEDKHILGYISDGTWARYESIDFGQGAAYFQACISTPLLGGTIEILLDDDPSNLPELLGSCTVPDTGGWQSWVRISAAIRMIDGIHAIRLRFRKPMGSGSLSLFELDFFSFSASAAGIDRDPATRIPSAQADSLSGNISQSPSGDYDGGEATTGWCDGNIIAFGRLNLAQACDWFEARVWIAEPGTQLEIHLIDLETDVDSLAGKLLLPPLSTKSSWQTIGGRILAPEGRKVLELIFRSPVTAPDFRLNWVRLSTLKRRPGPVLNIGGGVPLAASAWNTAHHIQEEPCTEGGHNIGYLRDGSFLGFDQVDFGPPTRRRIVARVATASGGGSLSVVLDGRQLAVLDVPQTGDWQNWLTISADMESEIWGLHQLECHFHGDDAFLFNLQWIDFPAAESRADKGAAAWRVCLQGQALAFRHRPQLVRDSDRASPGALVRLALGDVQDLLAAQGHHKIRLGDTAESITLLGPRGRLTLRLGDSAALFRLDPDATDTDNPAWSWEMPTRCDHRDGALWLPASAFIPLCGLLSRWDTQINLLDLRLPDPRIRPRGRIRNQDGILQTDHGEPLRGPTIHLDEDSLPAFAQLDMIRRLRFNCLHVLVASPTGPTPTPATIAALDDLVEYAGQNGLYLILGATCGSLPGWYDAGRLKTFWRHCAPRYAPCTQVIYELARQPHPWSDPYPAALLELERDLFDLISASAPASHVLLFSYANLSQPETVLRDLHALHLTESERARVSVAWVGFDRQMDRIASCLKVLRRQGWSSINTEIPAQLRNESQPINPRSPDLDLIRLCEASQTGWTASLPVKLLSSPEVWEQPAREAGITWPIED